MTYDEFAAEQGLTLDLDAGPARPGWDEYASHYVATITRGAATLTVPFSQGSAITDAPTVGEVIGAMALDASLYDDAASWGDMAADLGYDLDGPEAIRKARDDYEACGKEAADLLRLLGPGQYERLVHSGEVEE